MTAVVMVTRGFVLALSTCLHGLTSGGNDLARGIQSGWPPQCYQLVIGLESL